MLLVCRLVLLMPTGVRCNCKSYLGFFDCALAEICIGPCGRQSVQVCKCLIPNEYARPFIDQGGSEIRTIGAVTNTSIKARLSTWRVHTPYAIVSSLSVSFACHLCIYQISQTDTTLACCLPIWIQFWGKIIKDHKLFSYVKIIKLKYNCNEIQINTVLSDIEELK